MRRYILLLISSFAVFFASAQEEIFSDTIATQLPELRMGQPAFEKTLIFNDPTLMEGFDLIENSVFNQPLFPSYNKNLDFLKYLNPPKEISQTYSIRTTSFNPVFPFGHIFNQSAYRLNDRVVIGGNSFGAQSVFDQPKINSTIQDMSIKGASLFMQYKVNDHFKVQTRVSISNRRSSPWEP